MAVLFFSKRHINKKRTAEEEIVLTDSGEHEVDLNDTNTENTAEYFDRMMGIPNDSQEDG